MTPRRIALAIAALAGLAVAGVAALAIFLVHVGRAPRLWAPYIEHRAQGHNPLITRTSNLVAQWLETADRLGAAPGVPFPDWIGADPHHLASADPIYLRAVATTAELRQAIATAQPGDVIELMPGHYHVGPYGLGIDRPGTAAQPITLQALHLGDAVIDSDATQAIEVRAPYWHFINLDIHGVCAQDRNCAHALHIVGNAHDTILDNLRLVDFDAQVKVNAEGGRFPDRGILENSTLYDTHPRDTPSPVTPVDIDDASGWLIHNNLVADFVRANTQTSYGGYTKGAGEGTIFRDNVVLCAWHLNGTHGSQVGLSFGGGGMAPADRRDHGRSGFEQRNGTLADNLIAFCSDAGIDLNRAADTLIANNTLIDTAGIDLRYPQTSARIEANIVDGPIEARDGATITLQRNNLATPLLFLFLGYHPQRLLFADPARLDLRWRHESPPFTLAGAPGPDLCGLRRGPLAPAGAFTDFTFCRARPHAAPSPPLN